MEDTKICIKCGIEKLISDFPKRKHSKTGYRNDCKECRKEYNKNYNKKYYEENKEYFLEKKKEEYSADPEKFKERRKEYNMKNKDRINEYNRKYYLDNKEILNHEKRMYNHENREYLAIVKKKWNQNNPDKVKKHGENHRKRNPHIVAWRNILNKSLKCFDIKKKNKTEEYLKYTSDDLKNHLESQFKEGMSWENWGEWHVDHIIPLSAFKKDTPIHIVNSLENLQPLWAEENLSKSNTIYDYLKESELFIKYCKLED